MMDFDAFIKDIKDNNWNVFGVELYQKGEPVNHWGDTFNIHEIYSATKGITSIAVGIAYDEGLIDFDKSILEYLPKDRVKSLSKKQYERFEKISVRRLLTMSVADFPFRPEGEDWLEYSLACDLNPDIIQFNYSNIPVYIIC
ncbi:MAG: serine hydrolase, partial [Lachnospiraceae bacterium]|nr:serine hydrolase [Lachnospiraceae bacterium]